MLGAGAALAHGAGGPDASPPVTLVLAGDVMLGRGVAAGGPGPLDGVAGQLAAADLAAANLESPLTRRRHLPRAGPNALEAPPAAAAELRRAGLDAMAVANNHAGDAGPATVPDTLRALARQGIRTVGGGATAAIAFAPRIVRVRGIRVALLAFDVTGQGPRAGPRRAGVAWWGEQARRAVRRARGEADVVAVSLHGGAEYVPVADSRLASIARTLAVLGADVVWCHGPHVVQPVHVIDPDGDGRPTVVATSLGNLLFDQHGPGTTRGVLLELAVARDGVRALRIGDTDGRGARARFVRWRPPAGDAVALTGAWWTPARHVAPPARPSAPVPPGFRGDVTWADVGDADADGRADLVVSFRRPFRRTAVNVLLRRAALVDGRGRSAHLGLYDPVLLRPRWVAGTLVRPVAAVAACDGALAVAYGRLRAPGVVAAGAWRWGGFGFLSLPELAGRGRPACADVDGDGRLDPLVLERSPR